MSGCLLSSLQKVSTYDSQICALPLTYSISEISRKNCTQEELCVSYCVTEVCKHINTGVWYRTDDYFYNSRKDNQNSVMTVKEALDIALRDKLISNYYKIMDGNVTIRSIISHNMPVIVCLPVFNSTDRSFWKYREGTENSYRPVLLTGYSMGGFEMYDFYTGSNMFPYRDLCKVVEIWTVE